MKLTRSRYPETSNIPCWTVTGRWLWLDVDWNTKFPYGACLALRLGPRANHPKLRIQAPGLTLDLNAPMDEPNRLQFWVGSWTVLLGLVSWHTYRPTGREIQGTLVLEWVRTWPHLDGACRYRYHQTEDGSWERDARPAPLHWGWLTIDRRPV